MYISTTQLQQFQSQVNPELQPIYNAILSKSNKPENIVILDDNILLYAVSKPINTDVYLRTHRAKFKGKSYKNYTIREESDYLVYTKDGILFGEFVDTVARLHSSEGNLIGYVFTFSDIKSKQTALAKAQSNQESTNENQGSKLIYPELCLGSNIESDKGIIILTNEEEVSNYISTYTEEQFNLPLKSMYFIGNNIDNEIIYCSLSKTDPSIKITDNNNFKRLQYNNKTYKFSCEITTSNIANRKFSNIGKFVET